MTVSRTTELTDWDDDSAMLRDVVTVSFGGDGVPLAQLPGAVRAAARAPGMRAAKVGRNAPCPCGSGKKFKKCCGGSVQPAGLGSDHAGETDHG